MIYSLFKKYIEENMANETHNSDFDIFND